MAGGGTYTVRRGDNLSTISQQIYRCPSYARDIAAANKLPDSNLILVGMTLVLPVISPKPGGAPPRPGTFPAAKLVCYPRVEYDLAKQNAVTVAMPNGSVEIRLTGKLKLQKQGTLANLDISDPKSPYLSGSLKKEYDAEFTKTVAKYDWEIRGRKAGVKCGLTQAVGGLEVAGQPRPPNKMEFSATRPVKTSIRGWDYEGSFGFVIVLTYQDRSRPVPSPVPSHVWEKIAVAGGLTAAAILAWPLIVAAAAAIGTEAVAYTAALALLAARANAGGQGSDITGPGMGGPPSSSFGPPPKPPVVVIGPIRR